MEHLYLLLMDVSIILIWKSIIVNKLEIAISELMWLFLQLFKKKKVWKKNKNADRYL